MPRHTNRTEKNTLCYMKAPAFPVQSYELPVYMPKKSSEQTKEKMPG